MSEIGDYHVIRSRRPALIAPLIGHTGQNLLPGHAGAGHYPSDPYLFRAQDRQHFISHTRKGRFLQIDGGFHDDKGSISHSLFPGPEIRNDFRKHQCLHLLQQTSVREYPAGHILPVQTAVLDKARSQKSLQSTEQSAVLVVKPLGPQVRVIDRNPKSGEHPYHVALAAAYTACHYKSPHSSVPSLPRSNNMQSTYLGAISHDITPSGLDTSPGTISESMVLTKSA